MRYQAPKEQDLVAFYRTYISVYSQVQVAEDQFVAYWKQTADRIFGARFLAAVFLGAYYSLTYDIGEPVYNEARDQARFKVTVTIGIRQGFVVTYENRVIFVHVIKESGIWKMVLSDDVIKDMQKFPSRVLLRRFPVMREAFASGLRIQVVALVLDADLTSLEVAIENTTDLQVDLLYAISGAALTDEAGRTYASRTLRSTLSGVIAPKQVIEGSIAFFPIPPVNRRVVANLPDVRVGSESVNVSLEIVLGASPSVTVVGQVAASATIPPATAPSPQPSPTPAPSSASPLPTPTQPPPRTSPPPSPAPTQASTASVPSPRAQREPVVTVTREVSSATGWAAIVRVGGIEVFRIRTSYEGLDLFQRADAAAAALNRLISQGLKPNEVQATLRDGKSVILARRQTILTIDPGLARLNGTTPGKLAGRWASNLQGALKKLR